jgi:membrane protease YdiL (CAAX protease family)
MAMDGRGLVEHEEGKSRGIANDFGLSEAVLGFCVAIVLGSVAVALFANLSHHPLHPSNFGSDVSSLIGLWIGLIGATLFASRSRARRLGEGFSFARFRADYGIEIHLWPDALVGIVAGVASQYVLVPILEALLIPFVPHLFHRLSGPAVHLTSGAHGPGLWVLGFLVCIGSPCVEELFFRGLLLRSLAGRFAHLSKTGGAILSVGLTAVCFGLAHFEALQLIGLVGFGVVLGSLAWRTGRLGPGIVAHAAFNAVTFVALVGPIH